MVKVRFEKYIMRVTCLTPNRLNVRHFDSMHAAVDCPVKAAWVKIYRFPLL